MSITRLVGAKFRPVEIQQKILDLKLGDTLHAVAEPTNPHDPNAIKLLDFNDNFLGYVAATDYKRESLVLASDIVDDLGNLGFVVAGDVGTNSPKILVEGYGKAVEQMATRESDDEIPF